MTPISVVILTYRRREAVLRLLGQLAGLSDPDLEIVVVDNGSDDGTAAAVAAAHPDVRLAALPANRGVAARNDGLALARGEILVTLDDDMLALDDADLATLRTAFAESPRLGALNFKVLRPGDGTVRDWVHHRPLADADGRFETYEITEGAVAYRAAALADRGRYREDLFISHEGVELAFRLLDGGWTVAYDGRIAVEHHHDPGGRTGWRRYYYDTRNQFWIAALHMPLGYALGYLARGQAGMAYYALRDGHGLVWLRAVRDGLRGVPQRLRERHVWAEHTRAAVAAADAARPGLWRTIRIRLRQRDFSLD